MQISQFSRLPDTFRLDSSPVIKLCLCCGRHGSQTALPVIYKCLQQLSCALISLLSPSLRSGVGMKTGLMCVMREDWACVDVIKLTGSSSGDSEQITQLLKWSAEV